MFLKPFSRVSYIQNVYVIDKNGLFNNCPYFCLQLPTFFYSCPFQPQLPTIIAPGLILLFPVARDNAWGISASIALTSFYCSRLLGTTPEG